MLLILPCLAALHAAEPPPAEEDPAARLALAQAAWSVEKDPARRRELGGEVVEAAIHFYPADNADEDAIEKKKRAAIEEVAADGRLDGADIAIPEGAENVALTECLSVPLVDGAFKSVFRRISPDRVEIWTPKHGWLFDARGRIVAEAKPPRRDGTGREWFGAFLPDGRWVTTDLWDNDQTLHFFSAAGKFLREVPSGRLLPLHEDGTGPDRGGLIACARSDKAGKGWVVAIGGAQERGWVWVGPAGKPRPLGDYEPWALCQPRQLGAKGFYLHLYVPSDDRKLVLDRGEPGHGVGVGFPGYSVNPADARSPEAAGGGIACIPEGERFGFWPGSHRVFITTAEDYDWKTRGPTRAHTWFYDERRNFECRLAAGHVGDATDGRAMLFATDDKRVLTVAPDFRIVKAAHYFLGDRALAPRELHPDLALGLFADGQRLVLAGWKSDGRR